MSSCKRFVLPASIVLIAAIGLAALLSPEPIRLHSRGIAANDVVRALTDTAAKARSHRAQFASMAACHRQIAFDLKMLPFGFEPNEGQADKGVSFISHVAGASILLSPGETIVALQEPPPSHLAIASRGFMPGRVHQTPDNRPERKALAIRFIGANRNGKFEGLSRLPGVSNYYLGNDRRQWRTKVPTFAQVKYRSAYPGIDLLYYGSRRELEFDLIVAAGANPNLIRLGFDGTEKLQIDSEGNAIIHLGHHRLLLRKPSVYQEMGGTRERIDAKYVLLDRGLASKRSLVPNIGIRVANYDHQRPLVVDPALSYSTYLGGTAGDIANAVAIDSSDNNYITGFTCSNPFPTQAAEQTAPGGGCDAFVTKLNSTGTALTYSTYLGGSAFDSGQGIAVDGDGSAYITGLTFSSNFPTTVGPSFGGFENAFVIKLNADGSRVYSRYLGESGQVLGIGDRGLGVALVPGCVSNCNAYIIGNTTSTNFPTTPGVFQATDPGDAINGFVTQISSDGTTLVYSTYLGGPDSRSSLSIGIAVDDNGDAYVAGETNDAGFPVTEGAVQTNFGGTSNCTVSELNPNGSALNYSTFLGGSGFDTCAAIALLPNCSSNCNAYVTGYTYSTDFPTTPGAAQTTLGTGSGATVNGFVTELSGDGSDRVYSSYLGGFAALGQGIGVDSDGNAYIAGITASDDFPTVNPAQGAAGPNGVLSVSTDGGATFPQLGMASSAGSVLSMAFDNAGAIYAATRTGVYKSTDEGGSFSTTALTSSTLVLGFDPGSTTLYAGNPAGLVKSTDGGATFSSNLLPINATVFSIDVVPNNTLGAIRRASALGPLLQRPTMHPSLSSAIGKSQASGIDPGNNNPPPAGAIFDLSGTPIPGGGNNTYKQYTVDFTATIANTAVTFAFREDPAFISFSNASVVDVTTSSGNLLTNGDFSGGTYTDNGNSSTPIGWTYANQYGASAGGVVGSNCGVNVESGSYGFGNCWYDGAVQAYDAISQTISTTPGDQYEITFWVADNSGCSTDGGPPCDFSDLSTNGDTTGTGGNGINVTVYAQVGLPPPATSTIYVGTNQGLFKSTDGGTTFTQTVLSGSSIFSLLADPNNTAIVYAGTNKGLFESTDGGATFSRTLLNWMSIRALAADGTTNPTTIYAGSDSFGIGFFSSQNFNTSFNQVLATHDIYSIAIDMTTETPTVYAGADNGTLYESTDRGTTFNATGLAGVTGHIIYATALTAPNIYASEYLQDDGTLTELNPTGTTLLFSTYLQGSGTDLPVQVAVDPSGNAVRVVGETGSSDFPIIPSPGAFQTTLAGNYDAFLSIYGSPIVTPTITPTPTSTLMPTPAPTPTSVPTPIPAPTSTPSAAGMVISPPVPVTTAAGPGTTVNSGTLTVQNTSGTTLVTPVVTISFNNADLFSSATLIATSGPNTSTATVNPIAGGNSPEQPNNTPFVLQPPLVVPAGQTATYSLSVTVAANPQVTRRNLPVMYAAMVGDRATGSNTLLMTLMLLELCAAGISATRRMRLFMALLLLLALASQVGCDNGSVPSPPPATTGVIFSTQTAMELEAMMQVNNNPVKIAGLPIVMGTVSLK